MLNKIFLILVVFLLGDMSKGNVLSFEDNAILPYWMENDFLEKL